MLASPGKYINVHLCAVLKLFSVPLIFGQTVGQTKRKK